MKLIDYVFNILRETTPMDPKEHANLYSEISEDISKVVIDKDHENYKPTLKAKILGFFQNPWVRLGLACTFVIAVKKIRDWVNSTTKDEEEEEED